MTVAKPSPRSPFSRGGETQEQITIRGAAWGPKMKLRPSLFMAIPTSPGASLCMFCLDRHVDAHSLCRATVPKHQRLYFETDKHNALLSLLCWVTPKLLLSQINRPVMFPKLRMHALCCAQVTPQHRTAATTFLVSWSSCVCVLGWRFSPKFCGGFHVCFHPRFVLRLALMNPQRSRFHVLRCQVCGFPGACSAGPTEESDWVNPRNAVAQRCCCSLHSTTQVTVCVSWVSSFWIGTNERCRTNYTHAGWQMLTTVRGLREQFEDHTQLSSNSQGCETCYCRCSRHGTQEGAVVAGEFVLVCLTWILIHAVANTTGWAHYRAQRVLK